MFPRLLGIPGKNFLGGRKNEKKKKTHSNFGKRNEENTQQQRAEK